MSIQEKNYLVKVYKVGRKRFRVVCPEFDLDSIYRGTIISIEHRLKYEFKNKLIFDLDGKYLLSSPNKVPVSSPAVNPYALLIIRIPVEEVDFEKAKINADKLRKKEGDSFGELKWV